ncbi:magnesium-dependent phosphatase-1 [Glomus cerebriforme]|uniref:Magnesium-dependent phosphatase-1 n=1 Tax=Glomus cerebriforme TaxID=658196 RepID=A0A397SLF1_9GLOM|nr:magnesium-dependent phosphatase-1 [Glomus cerebriforme]
MDLLEELSNKKLLPSLFVFDIDYTLWPLWIDTYSGPTFEADPSKPYCAKDKYGNLIRLYSDVPKILRLIKNCPQTYIAVASRTHEPEWARKVLSIMPFPENEDEYSVKLPVTNKSSKVVNYSTLADVIDYDEIYPGSKINHFSSLHATTGIPYNEMIFFDDEMRNREVDKKLGVHFVHVPDGMKLELFLSAIKEFAKKRKNSFLI